MHTSVNSWAKSIFWIWCHSKSPTQFSSHSDCQCQVSYTPSLRVAISTGRCVAIVYKTSFLSKLTWNVDLLFRFIVHNDVNNPYLRSLEAFVEAVLTFSPSLLVVSGLQMMDNFPFLKGTLQGKLFPHFLIQKMKGLAWWYQYYSSLTTDFNHGNGVMHK